jgi:NADH:ubiquinone oxidoreductase subunit 6 (subunit J)
MALISLCREAAMVIRLRDVLLSLLGLAVVLCAITFFSEGPGFVQIILTYAIIVLAQFFFLLNRKPRAQISEEGWRCLSPSMMEWFVTVGCFVMTSIFTYVFFFVGSARADAASQMFSLKLLILGFGTITILCMLSFPIRVRWNEHCIQNRSMFFQPKQSRGRTWSLPE